MVGRFPRMHTSLGLMPSSWGGQAGGGRGVEGCHKKQAKALNIKAKDFQEKKGEHLRS